MKIYHLPFDTDAETAKALDEVDHIEGVLEVSQHHAWGYGPAYLVVVTQDEFNPELFQREYVLMYEENAVDLPNPLKNKKAKKSEVEVADVETVLQGQDLIGEDE